jgi:hypothetical protein
VAPGTWYLSKRRFPEALLYDFKLYGKIFYHFFDCPDIQKHKFLILLTMEIQIQAGAIADQSDISQVFGVDDIFTCSEDILALSGGDLKKKMGILSSALSSVFLS